MILDKELEEYFKESDAYDEEPEAAKRPDE